MAINPSKPHFTVYLDDGVGDVASLSESPDGELLFTLHPSAAEDGSPAHCNGRAVFKKAVEILVGQQRRPAD